MKKNGWWDDLWEFLCLGWLLGFFEQDERDGEDHHE